MIIDFHTHSFPEKIVSKALPRLAYFADTSNYTEGTNAALTGSMRENGVDLSVLMPVATNQKQTDLLNRQAIELNLHTGETGLLSFGAIHPDNEDYPRILKELSEHKVPGIKLHPVYQKFAFDDLRSMRIVDYASSLGLIVLVHAGYDVGFPGDDSVTVEHILPVVEQVAPDRLVLAHMGGWDDWDNVEEKLCGRGIYFDTAFCLDPLTPCREKLMREGRIEGLISDQELSFIEANPHNWHMLSNEQFCRLVEKNGADHILYGSDSPWSHQGDGIQRIRQAVGNDAVSSLILGENAARLLKLS